MAQAKAYFGLSCPSGGDFYVCEGAEKEFIGCCTSDPCADKSGVCPVGDLRTATFNRDRYAKLLTQDCDHPKGTGIWFTCAGIKPPFVGCCTENPCAGGGCPRSSLVSALLSQDDDLRQDFLYPQGGDDASSTGSSTTATASASASATGTPEDDGGLSSGAIAGIAVGVSVGAIIILALLFWKFFWLPRKRKQGDPMREVSPNEYQPQPNTPGTGGFPPQPSPHYSLASSPTMPYYPSGTPQDAAKYGGAGGWTPQQTNFERPMSLGYSDVSGMTPQMGHMSPQQQGFVGVAPVHNPVHAPVHSYSPQEMDASETVVQELGTGQDPQRVYPSQPSPGMVDSPTVKPDTLGIRS